MSTFFLIAITMAFEGSCGVLFLLKLLSLSLVCVFVSQRKKKKNG